MVFYIAYEGFPVSEISGIWKKIVGQMRALQNAFDMAYCTALNSQTALLLDGKKIVEKETALTRQDYFHILTKWIEKYGVRRTYVRYPFADKWFIELLRYQKEHNIKTVLEIPTYPYDKELPYGRRKTEDAYYREAAAQFVDVISTYSRDKAIWGKPCIPLTNGIDIETCRLSQKAKEKGKLTLIGVSSGMAVWMGYERLIEGLKSYYEDHGEYDIRVKLVGDGTEKNYYQMLTSNYGLKDRVDFCGFLSGTNLNQVYSQADIAIGSLGFYKIGAVVGSPIKGAEYCARGLPTICGYMDTRFPDGTPFILNVPNDASPIDMEAVIVFYEKLSAQEGYREKIREYAVQHLDWEHVMKPVIEYLR